MKFIIITMLFLLLHLNLFPQDVSAGKTRIVAGLSIPELFHVGVTRRLSSISLLGLNAGGAPSFGKLRTLINVEHRLYVGKKSTITNQKEWFFRQGVSFLPALQPQTLNFTFGKDFIFKNIREGITIDAGIFLLRESESSSIILLKSLDLWPALRFEFFFAL